MVMAIIWNTLINFLFGKYFKLLHHLGNYQSLKIDRVIQLIF
jgi:hypothetical protein